MKTILILDDNISDIQSIKRHLLMSQYSHDFQIFQSTTLGEYKQCTTRATIDLLLLDLEFTNLNTTSLSFLQIFSPQIPIIVVSNHRHYQHLLNSSGRISGFVSKSSLEDSLVPLVEIVLGYRTSNSVEAFVFPASKTGNSFKIPTYQVRYIQKTGRVQYDIYTISGKTISILSSSWTNVLVALKKQSVKSLKPVSQGIIVNENCISSIKKNRSGLLDITLVNLPNAVFTISVLYEDLFKEFLQY